MDLQLSVNEERFRDEVRAFLAAELTEDLKAGQRLTTTVVTEPAVAMEWHRRLYRQGWAAPSWPVEHGGPGWTPIQIYLFEQELALAGAPKIWASGVGMVGPVIIGFGSAAQQRAHLPRILSGEDYWCQGYSEPGAGSDLAALQTRAVREGDDYIVNGSKIWTTHAHLANRMFALVRTDSTGRKQAGISFLLIDMRSAGITVRPIRTIGGEHEVNEVFFDNVRVPCENRVGEEGQGWSYGKFLLEFERGGGAVSARLRAALARVAALAGAAALPHSESLRLRITELEIDLDSLAMTELRLMAARQAGGRPGSMSSLLKLRASELTQAIARLGLEAAGRDSLAWEPHRPLFDLPRRSAAEEAVLPVPSTYLNSLGYTIFGGSIEVQHDILAKAMLGL